MSDAAIPSSFRDPSGFLFFHENSIFRQINTIYKNNYDLLIDSGLYASLTDSDLLITHDEVDIKYARNDHAYKVIRPKLVPFISYPYEWSFSQLKDAALTTLAIQKKALDFDMSLKDCSAYNIQFADGKPIFIDTLSFEKYQEGQPWVAYRQFCQHFLAPLALMSHTNIGLNQLFRVYIDGIPLDLASSLLKLKTRFKFSLLSHIHLHAKSQSRFGGASVNPKRYKMSRLSFLGMIDNLESAVKKLTWRPRGTEWADYYDSNNYNQPALEHKKTLIADLLDKYKPENLWDLGANTGLFSRIAESRNIRTIAFDIDPVAVEKNYLQCVADRETNILPLLLDLSNPSPALGWKHQERSSLLERGPADMVFALALIHHLAIANNLPLGKIADFFSHTCKYLVIEFVPKDDSQVEKLLLTREDVFPTYTQQAFETAFSEHFDILESTPIKDSRRTLYMMIKKTN